MTQITARIAPLRYAIDNELCIFLRREEIKEDGFTYPTHKELFILESDLPAIRDAIDSYLKQKEA